MQAFHRRAAVVAVVAVASVGVSACGSSSSSKTTAKAPATPSTPSTTGTTAAGGPLTKARFNTLAQGFVAPVQAYSAAVQSGDPKAIAAAVPKLADAARNLASQVGALKAPSAAAASAQQKYVSTLKEYAGLLDQLGKAAAANDVNAAKALETKLAALGKRAKTDTAELEAALK